MTDYARAACGLQYKMDYEEDNRDEMCYQLYFPLKYSTFRVSLNN